VDKLRCANFVARKPDPRPVVSRWSWPRFAFCPRKEGWRGQQRLAAVSVEGVGSPDDLVRGKQKATSRAKEKGSFNDGIGRLVVSPGRPSQQKSQYICYSARPLPFFDMRFRDPVPGDLVSGVCDQPAR
jgi:hypothetical protein